MLPGADGHIRVQAELFYPIETRIVFFSDDRSLNQVRRPVKLTVGLLGIAA
jgi:hypothetical protein